MLLNDSLLKLQEEILTSLQPDTRKKLVLENAKLFSSFLINQTLKKGDAAPDVYFRDENLKTIYLKDLLNKHHIVLNFFRGTWCPYCNLELEHLNKINADIERHDARIVSISPELYKFSESFIKKNNLKYSLFTDLNNKAANEFGLVFKLPPAYQNIYNLLNIHLNKLNGDTSWTLPVPATFIISKDGNIASTYINADYTQRMEPSDIITQLEKLS